MSSLSCWNSSSCACRLRRCWLFTRGSSPRVSLQQGVSRPVKGKGDFSGGSLPYCHVIPGVTSYNLCHVLLVRSNLRLSFTLGKGTIWGVMTESWGMTLRSVCYRFVFTNCLLTWHKFGLVKMRKDTPPQNSYVIYYLDCVPHLCIF